MNILSFQAFIITIALIGVVIVFINNKLNYLELGGVGFGIFLLVITFMDHVDKKHYIVKEEDEYSYVYPEEQIPVEETNIPEEAESNLPLLNKTTGPLDSLTPQELSKYSVYLGFRGRRVAEFDAGIQAVVKKKVECNTPEFSTLSLSSDQDYVVTNLAYQINQNSAQFSPY